MYKSRFRFFRFFLFVLLAAAYAAAGAGVPLAGRTANVARAADTAKIVFRYIDVGQGDATFIEFPDGKTMIVDAGPNSGKAQLLDYFERNLTGVTGFDYVVLTHSDEDHCNNFPALLEKYPLKAGGRVYRPNEEATRSGFTDPAADKTGRHESFWGDGQSGKHGEKATLTYRNCIDAFYNQPAYTGETGGKAEIWVTDARPAPPARKVLNGTLTLYTDMDFYGDVNGNAVFDTDTDYAVRFYAPTVSHYVDFNNYSPIFTVDYRGRRALFSGDAEKEAEADFVKAVENGTFNFHAGEEIARNRKGVDTIKLGHHGSGTSSTADYLDIVLPADNAETLAVASANHADNNYNHPAPATVKRLTDDFGLKEDNILVTEQLGSVVISFGADGVTLAGRDGISENCLPFLTSDSILKWVIVCVAVAVVVVIVIWCVYRVRKRK
ncbi:MAG: MBL fold metallo-hydrolase [Clostridiales bacterium]|jgi:beta-lactamase superfamily II metal-dependent hydrolase|nr:MBL fold metallo-hydrolase [Clostridiales bacterium]